MRSWKIANGFMFNPIKTALTQETIYCGRSGSERVLHSQVINIAPHLSLLLFTSFAEHMSVGTIWLVNLRQIAECVRACVRARTRHLHGVRRANAPTLLVTKSDRLPTNDVTLALFLFRLTSREVSIFLNFSTIDPRIHLTACALPE